MGYLTSFTIIVLMIFLSLKDLQAQKISLSSQRNFTGNNIQVGLVYFQSNNLSLDGGLKFHFNKSYFVPNSGKQFFAFNPAQHFGLFHQIRYSLSSLLLADNFNLFLFHNLQLSKMGYKLGGFADIGKDTLGRTLFIEQIERVPRVTSIEQNFGLGIQINATEKINFTFAAGIGQIINYVKSYSYIDPHTGKDYFVYGGKSVDYFTYHLQGGLIYNFSPNRRLKLKD